MQIEVIKAGTVPVDASTSTTYPPGRYDVPDDVAKALRDQGCLAEEEAPAPKKGGKGKPSALADDQRIAAIADAIGKMDPSALGDDGKPKLDALSQAVGFDVSEADRDAAMAKVKGAA